MVTNFQSSKICKSTCLHAYVQRNVYCTWKRGFTSLMLHSLTVQSSLPLANFVGHTAEKSTDQALFSCSVNWENSWPVLASHNWKCIKSYNVMTNAGSQSMAAIKKWLHSFRTPAPRKKNHFCIILGPVVYNQVNGCHAKFK